MFFLGRQIKFLYWHSIIIIIFIIIIVVCFLVFCLLFIYDIGIIPFKVIRVLLCIRGS